MSDIGPPLGRTPPPVPPVNDDRSPPSPPRRDGCLTAIMVVVGIMLLLPGLCALLFGAASMSSGSHLEPALTAMVLLGLMVAAFGVFLIAKAIRGPRR
jgi:drug/metabolite transporter (DMT)-like permease